MTSGGGNAYTDGPLLPTPVLPLLPFELEFEGSVLSDSVPDFR